MNVGREWLFRFVCRRGNPFGPWQGTFRVARVTLLERDDQVIGPRAAAAGVADVGRP